MAKKTKPVKHEPAITGTVMPKKNKKIKKTTKTTTRTKTTRTYTYKWDVVSAQAEYVTNHQVSMEAIGKKYGVDKRTVQLYAAKHKWSKLREDIAKNAMAKFQKNREDDIEKTINKHVTLYQNLQSFGNNTLTRLMKQAGKDGIPALKGADKAIQALKVGIEGERTALGLPTLVAATETPADQNDKKTLTLTEMMEIVETRETSSYDSD